MYQVLISVTVTDSININYLLYRNTIIHLDSCLSPPGESIWLNIRSLSVLFLVCSDSWGTSCSLTASFCCLLLNLKCDFTGERLDYCCQTWKCQGNWFCTFSARCFSHIKNPAADCQGQTRSQQQEHVRPVMCLKVASGDKSQWA